MSSTKPNSLPLPGLATGILGLAMGILGYVIQEPALAIMAGICALAAGVAGIRMSKTYQEQAIVQTALENELNEIKKESATVETQIAQLTDTPATTEKKDTLLDKATGLFTQNFFEVALESRIASARRHLRPISVILLEASDNEELLTQTIKETIREADTACFLDSNHFALMLEDTPEDGAIWTVERIRKSLAEKNTPSDKKITVWAGIACYPTHAFGNKELIQSAKTALESAKDWKQDRIEVANSTPE